MEWEERDRMIDPMRQKEQAQEQRNLEVQSEFNALTDAKDSTKGEISSIQKFIAGCNEIGGEVKDKGGVTLHSPDDRNTRERIDSVMNDIRRHDMDTIVCDVNPENANNTKIGLHFDPDSKRPEMIRAEHQKPEHIQRHTDRQKDSLEIWAISEIDATPKTDTRHGEILIAPQGGGGTVTVDPENGVRERGHPTQNQVEPSDPNTKFQNRRARAELDEAMW